MEKNKVLDIIIEFVNAVKNEGRIEVKKNNKLYSIFSARYLLGQIIRQYEIPKNHYYISKSAQNKWKTLSNEDVWKYTHRNIVKCSAKNEVEIKKFKNNGREATVQKIKTGEKFVFNDVFHDEHIIPVKIIIEELLKIEKLSYSNVEEVLDKIYICRMLKEEDRSIDIKANRPFDFKKVIDEIYKPKGIKILPRILE